MENKENTISQETIRFALLAVRGRIAGISRRAALGASTLASHEADELIHLHRAEIELARVSADMDSRDYLSRNP